MKITEHISIRRLQQGTLAGMAALLLLIALLLALTQFSVLAEPAADLDVRKDVNTHQAGPGKILTYTIHITNNTTSQVNDVQLTDALQSELDYVNSLTATFGTFGEAGGVITWTGTLSPSGALKSAAVITFAAQINSTGDTYITNTAQVTGAGKLITHSVGTGVKPGDLEIAKRVSLSSARPDDQLTYTICITNVGYGAVNAVMTDDLDSKLNYLSGSASHGIFNGSDDTVTWSGSLGALEAATVTFSAGIEPPLGEERFSISNQAEITGAGSLVQTEGVTTTVVVTYVLHFPIVYQDYPPIPELNPIPTPGDNNSYRVSWESIVTDPPHDGYLLQEATDVDFTKNVQNIESSVAYKDIEKGSEIGTYYYRVRVDDADRWGEGPWSNVESVSFGFYDNFADSSSGWPHRSGPITDEKGDVHGQWDTKYYNGQYRIYVEDAACRACDWFYQPDALSSYRPPGDKYSIETKMKFADGSYWANMGLIFGANESNTKLYAFCLYRYSSDHKLGWFLVRKDQYDFPMHACSGSLKIDGSDESGTSREGWNYIKIGVDGDKVKVYIGGIYKGQYTMPGLSSMSRVGLAGGDYELVPVDIRFDDFKVVPNVEP